MQKLIENLTTDEERALYNLTDARVSHCLFAGPADGESALKECRDVTVEDTAFSLRYPLWHAEGFRLSRVTMDEKTRAAIWYASNGIIEDATLGGIKCLRECENIRVLRSTVVSPECGWRTRRISFEDSTVTSEYFMLMGRDVTLRNVRMTGKYSFQYVENMEISDSTLDTKDAFWHAKNVTVRDSVVNGEYLGWYSDGLTLIRCHIRGTQPLCYCKNLRLVDCTMEDTDLSFEYSDVEADVQGNILSVKNPHTGRITADSIGEIIQCGSIMENNCVIATR